MAVLRPAVFCLFGAVFGFLLSRAGATTYDAYAGLFLLRDPRLAIVIGTAVAVGLPGLALVRRLAARSLLDGQPIELSGKPMRPTLVLGGVLNGVGWGLAGTCPGTSLAMVGEGKLTALAAIVGILAGTYLYGWTRSRPR